jgi:CheY-like chemotaxis protein
VADDGRASRKHPTRVLIVDDEVNLRFAIERRLRKAGMETGSASTVRHAIERLRNEAYDVVLCDLRMPSGDGTQLLEWLGSYSPSTKAIVVSAFVTPEFREAYRPDERLRILEKPVDLDVLVDTIEEMGPRKGYYGNAIEVELFDYVQMIALSGRDKLIEVATPARVGRIWFEHGDIVHVEYGDYRGEMAFYKLLAVNRGTFKEIYGRPAPMTTVMRSSTHLLMEAARRSDEGLLEEDDEDEVAAPPHEDAAPLEPTDDESSFEDLSHELGDDSMEPVHANLIEASLVEASLVDSKLIEANLIEANLVEAPVEAQLEPPDPEVPSPEELFDEIPADTGRYQKLKPPVIPAVAGAPVPSAAASTSGAHLPNGELGPSASGSARMPVITDDAESRGINTGGHAIFEDADTRTVMLEQFWQFDGINGVAIISSTGKVLAEDMRENSSLVTLAGFYMRGAARIARTLGYNVFDGVVARSVNGQQMVMVSMGAASAVLSVEAGTDAELVRDMVMGVE